MVLPSLGLTENPRTVNKLSTRFRRLHLGQPTLTALGRQGEL